MALFYGGIPSEPDGQPHGAGIEWLKEHPNGPGFIHEQSEPHRVVVQFDDRLCWDPCLLQDRRQAPGQRDQVDLCESQES